MSILQRRRFNFFDKELLKDPETNSVFEYLKETNISCSTNGRGQLILGDNSGNVHMITRTLKTSTFQAFDYTITHLQQLKQNSILVSVGSNEPGANFHVKFWNIDKFDRVGKPYCLRSIKVSPTITQKTITCICAHDSLNYMAVGLEDGSIILFRGDITRDKQPKHKIIDVSDSQSALTGLSYRFLGKLIFLFAVTENETYSLNVTTKEKETKILLDSHGVGYKCSIISDVKQDNQFIIARKEAVYFYQPDGRGPCLVFEGEKKIVSWFRGNLIVVTKDSNTSDVTMSSSSSPPERNIVTIYDIQNKFISYSAPFPNVVDIIPESGSIYVLTKEGKLYMLNEKDTQTKLDLLFKKSLYSIAISLAKSHQYDDDGLAIIFTQYGDHLYSKGDYDGSVTQYIKAIGSLEASYVIRKFLDAQKIHNLTAYLEALHKKNFANEDHTTLLLNCYTNLKDVDKLNEFLMNKEKEINFDVEIAIRGLREAGYYTHALSLAEAHGRNDWYLLVQLEDQKNYTKALDFISKLDFHEAEVNLKNYGKILITHAPDETTKLLKKLCTDYVPKNQPAEEAHSGIIKKAMPEDFIHIFVNNQEKLGEFLEHMISVNPTQPGLIYSTLLELYLQKYNHLTDEIEKRFQEETIIKMLQNEDAKFDVNQALVLCQMNNFHYGILHLYEKAMLYNQILSYHMDNEDHKNVMKTCQNFGELDPNLWIQALWYFSQKSKSHHCNLPIIINEIERNNLLPPIMVVDIMAKSPHATLELVKDYLIKHLRCENEQINEDERLIKQYMEDTQKMRNQIEELKTAPKIFRVVKCSGCMHQLELPSVHFLCGHSYHQHCFESYNAENDSDCLICTQDNKKILEMLRVQDQNKDIHEQFHHHLERSSDGFSVVADYFGRGIFNTVKLVSVPNKSQQPASKNPFDE